MRTTLGIALAALALAFGACSSSSPPASPADIVSASPAPSAVGPTSASASSPSEAPLVVPSKAPRSTVQEVATMSPQPFTLTSTAFPAGGAIPRRFSCDGENVSPDLAWTGAPDGTRALVLIVTDPDARDFVHWLVYDITGSPAGGLPAGVSASPDAPPQGTNSFGKRGYGGPCPPSGTHHYRFTLSALDTVVELTGAPKVDALRAAVAGHVLAEAMLTGTYHRS